MSPSASVSFEFLRIQNTSEANGMGGNGSTGLEVNLEKQLAKPRLQDLSRIKPQMMQKALSSIELSEDMKADFSQGRREKMNYLQDLVPGCCKREIVDNRPLLFCYDETQTTILDEIINYVKLLHNQVEKVASMKGRNSFLQGMMASMCRKAHVVIVPFPTQGHINPMMDLAKKLADHGFFVTFVNTDHNHHRILQAKSHPIQAKEMSSVRLVSIPDGLAPDDTRTEIPKLMRAMESAMASSIKDLIQLINQKEEHKVTALIIDVTLCFMLDALCLCDDVAIAALWPALIATYGICYSTSALVSSGILPSNGIPKEQKIVKYLPFLPPINSDYLPWLFGEEADREYLFQVGLRNMKRIKQIKWVLFNSFYDLEAPIIDAFPMEAGLCPIGPLIPSGFLDRLNSDLNKTELTRPASFWAEELECLDWLDKQSLQSVIYVSFGSQAVMNERQMEELALGLEASQKPFLWVLRSDVLKLPPGYIERIGVRGCIVSWAPQLSVLSHPSTGCFITHCGWNSTMESIAMGVPMICWPCNGDQFINQLYIVEVWKVGFSFTANRDEMVEAREIVKAVERVVSIDEGLEMRKRAVRLGLKARGAVKEGGSSFINFHALCNAFSFRRV